MLPLLENLSDGNDHISTGLPKILADRFGLSQQEREQLLPSGRQPVLNNRIGWAHTYLKKAGLIETPKRGTYRITRRGLDVLREKPSAITADYLMRYPEFADFRNQTTGQNEEGSQGEHASSNVGANGNNESTPEELMEMGYRRIRQSLADELLSKVKESTPEFFERLVVDVLVRMGYGGSQLDAGKAIGRSGDGGIDGIIKEDRLGLDVIYIQAKRWEGTVGRPEIQKFVGALQGVRAKKGVFLTTSEFSREALEYVRMVDTRIVLVSGYELAEMMIDYGVGVTPSATYEVKKLDQDYFLDE